jgi:hypothetical protein
MKYRVWCLSWEDDEEYGHDVIPYDSAAEGIRERKGVLSVSRFLCDAADAAEAYADYCHGNRDGWEATWPLVFRVRLPDGTTEDYEVEREAVPQFTASRKRA